MADKNKSIKKNPQLWYRVEQEIQDEYKKVCEENCLNPGKLIRQFMLDTIEKYKRNEKKLKNIIDSQ